MANSHTSTKESGKGGWKMPEPIFRVSDGYSPLKSNDAAAKSAASSAQPEPTAKETSNLNAAHATEENLPDITLFNVNPSDLKTSNKAETADSLLGAQNQSAAAEKTSTESSKSETSFENKAINATNNKAKNKTAFVFFAVLGVLVIIVLAAALLVIAYLWFYYRTSPETQF